MILLFGLLARRTLPDAHEWHVLPANKKTGRCREFGNIVETLTNRRKPEGKRDSNCSIGPEPAGATKNMTADWKPKQLEAIT
jgi:hypothetical protein